MTKALTYLNDLVHIIDSNGVLPVDEINIDGSWWCGKTYASTEFCIFCSQIKRVAIYCIRQEKYQIEEMVENFRVMLDDKGIVYTCERKTNGFITIKNVETGTKIRFIYIKRHTNVANARKFSGLASAGDVDYIITFADERYEISDEDMETLKGKVRGNIDTQYLVIQVCNPYFISEPYIKYLNHNLPYNRNLLSVNGQQFVKKDRKIFHHINWRATRDVLSEKNQKQRLEDMRVNRNKALTIDLGIPSYDDSSTYGSITQTITKPYIHYVDRIVCGVDVGSGSSRGAGLTGCLIGFYQKGVGVDFFDEYVQGNKIKEIGITQRADEIINFIMNQIREYRVKCKGYGGFVLPYVSINVDNASVDFISRINERIVERNLTKVMCARPNRKKEYEIDVRINFLKEWIINNRIRIDLDKCKVLYEELSTSRKVGKNDLTGSVRANKNDHLINTLEYAMEDIWLSEKFGKNDII